MKLPLLLLVCCICLGACQSVNDRLIDLTDRILNEDNAEPPNPLFELETELDVKTMWREKVGVGSGGQFVKLVIAASADKIIVADREGLVQAFHHKTGDLIWQVETGLPISAGPGLGLGTVLLGTSDAGLIALGADDGSTLWTANLSSEVLSVPAAASGIVVVSTIDGRLRGLDENNGEQLWLYERRVPSLTLRGTSSPVIHDDLVIHGYATGKIVALTLNNGRQEWESIIAVPRGRSELERLVDIDAEPIIVDGVVYAASFQGGVSAISSYGGELLWRKEDISSFSGMAADWRYLYLTDEISDLWQLDQRNGSALWKQTELHQRKLTAPVTYKDYVAVGDFEGYVHWLSQDDGRQLGRKRIASDPIEAVPVVYDDTLYVYSKAGTLAALTVE